MKIFTTILITISFASQIFGQCLGTEQEFKDYYLKNISTSDPIEGIWSANTTIKKYDSYNRLYGTEYNPQLVQWAIIGVNNKFKFCNFSHFNNDYSDVIISKTASSGIYLYQKTFSGSKSVAKANISMTKDGVFEYSYEVPKEEVAYRMGEQYVGQSIVVEIVMIKLYPSIDDFKKFTPSSGTGFALSTDGLIVTNHHVVNGSSNLKVRGINGDFSKTYKAKIIVNDKKNDLSIIKIDDISFLNLGTIPYILADRTSEVGTSIYCLGYPLRTTMGDDVKLTNGIVSAKSGFDGDITTYQITAPVQPGNSGGPLFDDKGNLIGIISSKHLDAENVSYAIKVSYLLNLIDIMPITLNLLTVSTLSNKTLAEQVKIIKNFTYIIESN